MSDTIVRYGPQPLSLPGLFLKFLRFGALAFGGPVAQISMLRQALVEEERWIEPARFNRLLAVLQVLPGPEAHELCVHLGMLARGRIGGILAGLGFMLPGFLLMLVAGWAYTTWIAGEASIAGALLGVQIVMLAVIMRAVVRIGEHVITDRWLVLVAAFSLIATLVGAPFWIPLIAGGLAYALASRPMVALAIAITGTVLAMILHPIGAPVVGTIAASGGAVSIAALFLTGLKGGLLTFGGAYTAIPYIRTGTVGRGWIDDATFLDGLAIASVLPAPLVIFATFAGYVAGGFMGALAITAGMFLPAFAFSLILFERLEAIVESPALHRLLAGVAAAVIGVIAATFVQLAQTTAVGITQPWFALALFAAALIVIWRVKGLWVTPAVVAGGGVMGHAIAF